MARIQQLFSADLETTRRINELLQQLSSNPRIWTPARLLEHLDHKSLVLLVAREQKQIVGMASIYFKPTLSKNDAWVEDVVVHHAWRRRGIARALMGELISAAKRRSITQIHLTSNNERAAAMQLYRDLGFEEPDTNHLRLKLEE